MSPVDPFGKTDQLDHKALDAIATRLEARGKRPFFQKMMSEYLDAMDIDSARTVLDLGCGTGVVARSIARRTGFSGVITGIDLSPHLVEAAQRLSKEEGMDNQVEFRAGDTRSLDIQDHEFDAVVAHTLLSHVEHPHTAVNELARVVKRGGMVGIFDGDYASLTFGHEDPEKGKEYDEAINSAVVTNPRVMRQMPRLLREAGLQLVASFSYVLAEQGKADFWIGTLEMMRRVVPASGDKSEGQINAWVDARLKDSEEGVFFGAINYYGCVAKRA